MSSNFQEQGGYMTRVSIPSDIAERAQDFVGRLWVLNKVIDWVDRGNERFLLITGQPGSGKTALAAWLAGAGPRPSEKDANSNLERVRDQWAAAHFCVGRGQIGTLDPTRFAQSLAHQLSDRYDDYAEAVLQRINPEINIHQEVRENWGSMVGAQIGTLIVNTDAKGVYNRVIREPLEALFGHRPDLRVFILVDALDEALSYVPTTIVTLLAGSDDLPAGVRFLLTSRNDPKVSDQFQKKRSLNLSSPEYGPDSDADIRAYLRQRMAEATLKEHMTAIGWPAGVEDLLVEHVAGNFLYTEFLLDEVVDGKRSLANTDDLPRGLYGLYRQYLDTILPDMLQVNASPRWVGEYQPLLGSLSVATPAAPRAVLPAWLERPKGQVSSLLIDVNQVTEDDPSDGGGVRLYHRSMAEFLALAEYQEDGGLRLNRYYTPPDEQHERIIRYYVTKFQGQWQECDFYGLRQLISHLRARLRLEQKPADRRKLAEELYAVVLDPAFQGAQREKLGDLQTTLSDLRTALEVALANNDLVKALACAGIYRSSKHSQSIAQGIFDAIRAGNFELALQRAAHYGIAPKPRGRWEAILLLYLAWEAAEQGNIAATQKVMASAEHLPRLWGNELADALLVRTAHALARASSDARDARAWLSQLDPGQDPDLLLSLYNLAQPPDIGERQAHVEALEHQLYDYRQLVDEGDPLALDVDPLLDEEEMGVHVAGLRNLLVGLAADEAGQNGIDRMLELVLPNPYPRYRDIGLVALGVACLSVPDPFWVRQRLQSILRTALDREGVTFTFDLPALLLAEAEKRHLSAQELATYLARALSSEDLWGTATRAHSARAAALFRQGQTAEAIRELEEAAWLPRGFAGYAVVTMLSLASRWWEFGHPESAAVKRLVDEAALQADNVRDPQFRAESIKLVEAYRGWSNQSVPSPETVQATLFATLDPVTRRVYEDFISARWVGSTAEQNQEEVKMLVPIVLPDGTALDTILGRLVGLSISRLSDGDLAEAIRLCTAHFTSGRPWDLGQWR